MSVLGNNVLLLAIFSHERASERHTTTLRFVDSEELTCRIRKKLGRWTFFFHRSILEHHHSIVVLWRARMWKEGGTENVKNHLVVAVIEATRKRKKHDET